MPLIIRRSVSAAARTLSLLCLVSVLGACSSDDPAPAKKKGFSVWPFGERSMAGVDATSYLEYHRSRSTEGAEPFYTLSARNTHMTKTIVGTMRTTMETGPGDMKMDSQTFTIGPAEQKKLLVYPTRFSPTYEVTATFRE